ncbi:PEGA domain-containing protein [Treponema sp. R80B11-R83G3]
MSLPQLIFMPLLLLLFLPGALTAREAKDIVEDAFEERAGTGLEIYTNPSGVRVYIDGVDHGLTPLVINNPAVGIHLIRLTLDGYKERSFNINLFSTSRLTVSIKMEEMRGLAMVSVYREKDSPDERPLNPQIYANVPEGITTPVIPSNDNKILLSLPVGYNTIKIRAFGWEDSLKTVLVNEYATAVADVFMKPAVFKVENVFQRRKRFNPMNPGNLGVTEYSFEVSAPGMGTFTILDANGSVVYEKKIDKFDTWVQNVTWDGKDSQGNPHPEGVYMVLLEASAPKELIKEEEKPFFIAMKTEISYSAVIFPLSVESGISGLTFTPLPHALPAGSFQFSANLLFGSFLSPSKTREDERKFLFPFSISMRISPFNRFELTSVFNITPQPEDVIGLGISGSVKYNFLDGNGSVPLAFSLGTSYAGTNSNGEYPLSSGRGAGIFTPLSLELTNLSIAFCPIIFWHGPEGLIPQLLLSTGVLYHSSWIAGGISMRYEFDFEDNARSRLLAGMEINLFPPPSNLFFSFRGGIVYQQDICGYGGIGVGLIY